MALTRRPLFYGLCLLAGSLLISIAGLMHPMLTRDGAAQLATIAATAYWRAIHWALLFGFPLTYMGLIGVALRHGDTPGPAPVRAGVVRRLARRGGRGDCVRGAARLAGPEPQVALGPTVRRVIPEDCQRHDVARLDRREWRAELGARGPRLPVDLQNDVGVSPP